MFPKSSYFDQVEPDEGHLTEMQREARKVRMEKILRDDGAKEQVRSWANDLNDCLNALGNVDTGKAKYGARTFSEAMERIDEIVREMDEYGR